MSGSSGSNPTTEALLELGALARRHRAVRLEQVLRAAEEACEMELPRPDGARETIVAEAVAHHLMYRAQHLSEADGGASFRQMMAWFADLGRGWNDSAGTLNLVSADSRQCDQVDDSEHDSPLFILRGESANAGHVPTEELELLAACGLDVVLQESLGVLIHLGECDLHLPSRSYSVSALPCSVFLDRCPKYVRHAEMVLHEASHCLLNSALHAAGESLPLEPLHYSPWKQMDRPPHGIVHASFAFSLLVLYFDGALADSRLDEASHAYCATRLRSEITRLERGADTTQRCLELVGHPAIRGALRVCHERALETPAPSVP